MVGEMLPWTAERKARFIELFNQGLTHSAIAAELGGTTKNACVSISRRLGLADRRTGTPRPGRKERAVQVQQRIRKEETKPRAAPTIVKPLPTLEENGGAGVSIWKLNHTHCRWPIAGEGAKMRYCGAPKFDAENSSYCEEHYHRSIAPRRSS
jgi:hypothetical protein